VWSAASGDRKANELRPQHKRATKTKVLIAAAGVAVAAGVAIAIPQADAADKDLSAQPREPQTAITGTAWAVDPGTGQMVVTADSTVTGDRWDTLMTTVQTMGDQGKPVRVERSPGQFRLFAEGGDAIFAGGGRCSLGFNVTLDNGSPGFITAGHCGVSARQWSLSQGGRAVATVQQSTFPGAGDFSLLTYNNPATQAPSAVDVGGGRIVQIRQAGDAQAGQQVLRMGSTTGLHDGQVTRLNAAVNYPEGRVTGLIQTTVCAEPGDSGGPLFTQNGTAVGLTSGGSGDCRRGGVTFFQPVTTALAEVGAEIG
jgi:streptogrisin D